MNIIIFGATGFIGKNLTNSLINQNHNITIVSRNLSKVDKIFKSRVQKIKLNYDDTKLLSKVISKNDIVINLAGENIASGFWSKKHKQKILDSRIRVGSYISKAITDATKKPQLLIQASAIGYYGYQASQCCNENTPKGEGFLANICEEWEKSTEQVEKFGVKRIIIRTGVVFGQDEGMLSKLITPIKFFVGSNLGKANNYISWIHIEDEIRAIEFLIQNKESNGVYNLVSPNPITSGALNKAIGILLDRPIWLKIPTLIVKLIFGDMAVELLLADQKIYPEKLMKEGFKFKHDQLNEALQTLL